MKANYHCHTERCFHAIGADEAYVEAAVKGGFDVLGFSDHGPWPFEHGYVSHMRLPREDVPAYMASIRGLKEKYQDQIEVHIGFEQEYWPRWKDYLYRLREAGVEYFILGQHMIDSETLSPYVGQFVHTDDGILRYADSVCEGIRTGLYSYIAHPDLFMIRREPHQFNRACEQATEMICQACRESDVPLEYNLLGAGTKRPYPCHRFWELAVKHHPRAILGVDAHDPKSLMDEELWNASRAYLEGLGFTVQETLNFKEV